MAADVQTEEVRQECDWLSVALSTAWAICDHRAANLLASWESLPGALPLLLNKDTMAKGLQFCKKLAQVFVAASKRQEPHILAMVKRSWLNTAGGHHIMQHLSWSDFKTVSKEVSDCVSTSFAIGQTRLQEKNCYGQRQAETKEQNKKGSVALRRWLNPVWLRLACNRWKYKEVDFRAIPRHTVLSKTGKLPKRMFNPRKLKTSLEFNKVTSKSQAVPWPIFSAQSMVKTAADFACLAYAFDNDRWVSVQHNVLSQLAPRGTLIRKHAPVSQSSSSSSNSRSSSGSDTNAWQFSAGVVAAAAVRTWPAVEYKSEVNGGVFYAPQFENVSVDKLGWFVIHDANMFESVVTKFAGPLALDGENCGASPLTMYKAMSEPQPLLEVAVRECLYTSNATFLKQLASHHHVQLGDAVTF